MNIRQLPVTMLPLMQLVNNEGQITDVPANPRLIKDDQYKALVKSLQEDDLTGVEPLKVYPMGEQFVVLGGNMRFRALQELKAKDVACIIVPEDTPAKVLRKIVTIDNSQFGEYDWDMLANEWEAEELKDWGVDVLDFKEPNIDDVFAEDKGENLKTKDVITIQIPATLFEQREALVQDIEKVLENYAGAKII